MSCKRFFPTAALDETQRPKLSLHVLWQPVVSIAPCREIRGGVFVQEISPSLMGAAQTPFRLDKLAIKNDAAFPDAVLGNHLFKRQNSLPDLNHSFDDPVERPSIKNLSGTPWEHSRYMHQPGLFALLTHGLQTSLLKCLQIRHIVDANA